MKRFAFILLSLSLSLFTKVRAAEPVVQDSFDCGEQVRIEATPLPGYRFVAWSDGDTARVRVVDVDGPIELTAMFEPLCREPQAPIDRVYDWLLVVNRNDLVSQGWLTAEASDDNVKWYRIIEPIDPIGEHDTRDGTCDQMVMSGFSLVLDPSDDWKNYYAEVNVLEQKAKEEYMCTTIMRGFPLIRSDLETVQRTVPDARCTKYEKDGVIYIKRNETLYTIDGQKLITNHKSPITNQ